MKNAATPLWIIVILLIAGISYYLIAGRQPTMSKADYQFNKTMYQLALKNGDLEKQLKGEVSEKTQNDIEHYGEILKKYKPE